MRTLKRQVANLLKTLFRRPEPASPTLRVVVIQEPHLIDRRPRG
jgi:hypothetical protein